MNTSSAGQDHETLVATVLGDVLERDPDRIRVVHTDSLNALLAIAAHKPNTGIAELQYDVASVSAKGALPTVDGRNQMYPCFSFA